VLASEPGSELVRDSSRFGSEWLARAATTAAMPTAATVRSGPATEESPSPEEPDPQADEVSQAEAQLLAAEPHGLAQSEAPRQPVRLTAQTPRRRLETMACRKRYLTGGSFVCRVWRLGQGCWRRYGD
jgi:hypothetical protein